MAQQPDKEWVGTPLEMALGIDTYGIAEVVIEFDTGEEEILVPQQGEEFGAYEFEQASTYLHALKHHIPT